MFCVGAGEAEVVADGVCVGCDCGCGCGGTD